MKKMKLFFAATLVFLTIGAAQVNAQEKTVAFGVKAGVNLTTLGGNLDGARNTFKYQAGITVDILLVDHIYILTGLDFQTKGAKFKLASVAEMKYSPMYLQLPATLGYKFDLGSDVRLVVNAGPYLSYGIGGKAKGDGESLKLFSDNIFKRLDYGVIGGGGIEFGRFAVSGGYDLGFRNISHAKGAKARNRNAYLTVGVKF